jgi:bacterioferritin
MSTMNGVSSLRPGNGLLQDVQSIRQRARQRIDDGVAAPASAADHEMLQRLNDTLITHVVAALRYRRSLLVSTIRRQMLLLDQQEHDGPMHPKNGRDLERAIREDLAAERIAIECYRDIARSLQGRDHGTRRLLEGILAIQEQHAEELSGLLDDLHRLRTGGTKDTLPQLHSVSRRQDHS